MELTLIVIIIWIMIVALGLSAAELWGSDD